MNYIGIDIGTTNIKIIEVDNNLNIINKEIFEKKSDIKNIINEFIKKTDINLSNIEKIVATGIGTGMLDNKYENIDIEKIQEFIAISNGGELVNGGPDYLVASIGTGTAFVKNKNNEIAHVGGTGVGGGTFINMCKRINPQISFNEINKITETMTLENVDLWIKDITDEEIKTLPKDVTAVNLGKLNEKTSNEEWILGILNMIFETIGVMAAFAAKGNNINRIITIGQLVKMPYAKVVFDKIELLHHVEFIIPENPEFMVALGAVKSYLKELIK